MKIWKIGFLVFLIFSMIIISGSIYRAVINRDKTSSQTSSILPYYSMKVNLASDTKNKPADVTYLDDLDLGIDITKTPFKSDKKYEFVFSEDSKYILLKIHSLDQNYDRNFNQIYLIDATTRQILKEFKDLNMDYFFDGGEGLITVKKTFFDDQALNKGFELMQSDRVIWKYENTKSDHGGMWQISDMPVYLAGKNLVIVHLFDPLDSLGKHLIKVFDLNQDKELYSFEVKPFSKIRVDTDKDFVYTEDENRFDTDFFDLDDGKRTNIDNKNFILASSIVDSDHSYKFLSNSLQEYDSSTKGKYMDISKPTQVIKVWDMETQSLVDKIEVLDQPLTDILATKDSSIILVGSTSEAIQFIDVKSKTEILTLMPNDDKQRESIKDRPKFKIQLSPDQKTLVAIGFDAKVHIWSVGI